MLIRGQGLPLGISAGQTGTWSVQGQSLTPCGAGGRWVIVGAGTRRLPNPFFTKTALWMSNRSR